MHIDVNGSVYQMIRKPDDLTLEECQEAFDMLRLKKFGIETSDGEDFKIATTENQEKNVLELEVDTSSGQSDSKNSKENDYLLSKIEDLEVNLSNTKAEITELEATLKKFKASIKKSATESKDMSTQTEQS